MEDASWWTSVMVEHSVTVRVLVTAAVERADKVRRRVVT